MISRSNFQKKNDQTWVNVMTAADLYNGISLDLVLLTFEVIIICGKKIVQVMTKLDISDRNE